MKNIFVTLIVFISIAANAKDYCCKETFPIIKTKEKVKLESTNTNRIQENEDSEDCRICCTISIPNGLGGVVGITACSGNIFTSCETAGQDACEKAGKKALEMVLSLN